jgi:translocation and assembly module TamA
VLRFRLFSLSLLLFPSYILAEELKLEVQGLSGELESNVNALVSVIDTNSDTGEQRIRRQFFDAIKKGLRAKGYYEPQINFERAKTVLGKRVLVANVDAGEPVLIEETNVHVTGAAQNDPDYIKLLRSVPTKGDILDHGKYDSFKSSLTNLALRNGYFDAELKKSQLAVAPQLYQGFWDIDYDSGDRYRFGRVTFVNSQIREEYLQNLVPFKEGDYYDSEQLAEFSRRLSSTNWFNSVVVSPGINDTYDDKRIPMETLLSPRNKNMMELGVGYSTDVGPRAKINWKRPWINSRGQSLEASTTVSAPEQSLDFTYKIPLKVNPLEQYYLLQTGFKREDQNDTRSDSTMFNVARYWNTSSGWQRAINLRWSLDHFTQADETHTTMLLYPGLNINRTRQRGGLMPRWGDSQRYSVDISDTTWGSDVDFIVFQAQNVWIRTLADKHRFIARGNIGWIETNAFKEVPPSLRFFAGGDRSVRGYKYKSISPKDDNDKLTGGSRLATGSIEYQYNVTGKWWGAAFFDAGEAVHDFSSNDLKKGAGVGIRWESPVGPIKLDVARPVGDKDNKSDVQFYIGLGPEL